MSRKSLFPDYVAHFELTPVGLAREIAALVRNRTIKI